MMQCVVYEVGSGLTIFHTSSSAQSAEGDIFGIPVFFGTALDLMWCVLEIHRCYKNFVEKFSFLSPNELLDR